VIRPEKTAVNAGSAEQKKKISTIRTRTRPEPVPRSRREERRETYYLQTEEGREGH